MIDLKTKIHDRYSIEFKMGFVARRKLPESDFSVYTWIFVPSSLDINKFSYSKSHFYRDVKSNIRLITPRFLLRDIAQQGSEPLSRLSAAMNAYASNPCLSSFREYEHQMKLFAAIIKSSLRDESSHILSRNKSSEIKDLSQQFARNTKTVFESFHRLRAIINAPTVKPEGYKVYAFTDEFICDTMVRNCMKLLELFESGIPAPEEVLMLKELIATINEYRRDKEMPFVKDENREENKKYYFRQSMLKKYVEGILYLRADKKKDGVVAEQLLFSVSAGLAMIFATLVAWAFQRHFGNLTWPLFIALIISYMLKDRIKELMRYYFAHKVGSRFFDNKASIRYKDISLGWLKEGVDFISESKVPERVMDERRQGTAIEMEESMQDEHIMLYRKSVHINRKMLDEITVHRLDGVNDIMRLNIHSFLWDMDNPTVPSRVLDRNGRLSTVELEKVYYINIVMECSHDDTTDIKHFRIELDRDGIREIKEI